MTLFGEIDECVAVLDFPCPVPYVFSAGVIYANFAGANSDLYDLEQPLPSYTWYTEAFYGRNDKPLLPEIPPMNPAIKMCVHNYAWVGYPSEFFSKHIPTIVVGEEQGNLFDTDSMNIGYMDYALTARSLPGAMHFAQKATGVDKVLVFDGAMGGMNVSRPLAELLMQKAPEVSRRVEQELLPKWLRQRGVSMDIFNEMRR